MNCIESRPHAEVALVTGAGGGIGAAVVARLSRLGTRVAALDLELGWPTAFASSANAEFITPFRADISDSDTIKHVVNEIEETIGPITQLINAAGVLRPAAIVDVRAVDIDRVFAVNVVGTMLVSSCVAQRMAARGHGAIVTIGSNAAHSPRVGMAVYAASRAAAEMFTKTLGLEMARYGVRCNIVSPGSTDTTMLRSLWAEASGSEELTLRGDPDNFRLGIPLGRIGRPEDVANAVAFLLSEEARQITMQSVTIDGGATLGA